MCLLALPHTAKDRSEPFLATGLSSEAESLRQGCLAGSICPPHMALGPLLLPRQAALEWPLVSQRNKASCQTQICP